jgi:hypothetical protein
MIIASAMVANGYNITFRVHRGGMLYQVVAAAQVHDYPPLPASSIRVIVAPARVPT